MGLPETQLNRLKRLKNTAAGIVTCKKKIDSVNILDELHWLPVRDRITFKLMLLIFKALNGLGPKYLSELLIPYAPERTLRSQDQLLLQTPRSRLKTAGDRAFSVAGPKLWNTLPYDVRASKTLSQFKTKLKTHLFSQAKRTIS